MVTHFDKLLATCVAILFACNSVNADDKLEIGSKAPNIDIEYWLSDNDGLFEHVTEIEEGKVYVVEFWATWCGPCIVQMPHISKIQREYENEVQIISVSDEDLDTVEAFLERKVPGDKEKRTFRELTNNYCLTTDPDGSVYADYFKAAGLRGIPSAFIVGKSGRVEWIGHPGGIDSPLKKVINDEWDRDEFKTKYEEAINARKKELAKRRKLSSLLRPVAEKIQSGDIDDALETLDGSIQEEEDKEVRRDLKAFRLQILMREKHEGLAGGLEDLIGEMKSEDPIMINNLIWSFYELHESKGDVPEDVLKVCLDAAKWAVEEAPESSHILDTYAHLVYVVENDLDKAIEYQERAVKAFGDAGENGPEGDDIRKFLKDLKEEKRTGKKPAKPEKKKKKKTVEESDF